MPQTPNGEELPKDRFGWVILALCLVLYAWLGTALVVFAVAKGE